MSAIRVLNQDFESVCNESYDLCFFSSGFESRCVHCPSLIPARVAGNVIVIGFFEEQQSDNRVKNDNFFRRVWGCEPTLVSGDDERPIFEFLNNYATTVDRPLKILVDYSSMSRLWYTAVLNWARFRPIERNVSIDFVYSVGAYEKTAEAFVIRSMITIPGCEGRAYRLRESVAVLGLGFHGDAALCVLDHLEADRVYIFLASPGSKPEYDREVHSRNKELIKNRRVKQLLKLPLDNVASCYRSLAETIAPYRADGEVTLVPMGPKPHVLASILIAMRFPEVACLRVSSSQDVRDVVATGDVIVTRVIISAG